MTKNRMESFSDGVLAIVLTIMVLNFRMPGGTDFHALTEIAPSFFSYLLSFVFIGIYWSNHHHLLHAVKNVNGKVLWANLHLLFWLSLTPFVTGWIDSSHFASLPVAAYGTVMLLAAVAYYILAHALLTLHGRDSLLAMALGNDSKGKISIVLYAVSIPLAFAGPLYSCALFIVVAVLWLIPDRRIEKTVQ